MAPGVLGMVQAGAGLELEEPLEPAVTVEHSSEAVALAVDMVAGKQVGHIVEVARLGFDT